MIRRALAFIKLLLESPGTRHARAVSVFKAMGFTPEEANRAALQIWYSARTGTRPPEWIGKRVEELRELKLRGVSTPNTGKPAL